MNAERALAVRLATGLSQAKFGEAYLHGMSGRNVRRIESKGFNPKYHAFLMQRYLEIEAEQPTLQQG